MSLTSYRVALTLIYWLSSYRAVNTLRRGRKNLAINAVRTIVTLCYKEHIKNVKT